MALAVDLFAWVTKTHDRYSLVGIYTNGQHMPLISTSRATIEGLRDAALAHCQQSKQPLYLVRYTQAESEEVYHP